MNNSPSKVLRFFEVCELHQHGRVAPVQLFAHHLLRLAAREAQEVMGTEQGFFDCLQMVDGCIDLFNGCLETP